MTVMQNCESNLQKWDPQMWLLKIKVEFMFAKTSNFCGEVIYITQNKSGQLNNRLLVFIPAEFYIFFFFFFPMFLYIVYLFLQVK